MQSTGEMPIDFSVYYRLQLAGIWRVAVLPVTRGIGKYIKETSLIRWTIIIVPMLVILCILSISNIEFALSYR